MDWDIVLKALDVVLDAVLLYYVWKIYKNNKED